MRPAGALARGRDPLAPAPVAGAGAVPTVWVLLGKGTGGNGQMRSLADALGWPYEEKRLVHNPLNLVPNVLLGPTCVTVDRRKSSRLGPPWPDLVIGASRRSAPVARWIKRCSGGRTRIVHLLHTQAPLEHFDLVITLPQYRLPERDNVLHNVGPLNRIDPERIRAAGERLCGRWHGLPRPWTALLVGGNSSSYLLDAAVAKRLGQAARRSAGSGSLLVSTSPRTPTEATDALFAAIEDPAYLYRWKRDDPDNPYLAYLASADRFIVTVDSASLAIEACATGKPVEVFEWERRGGATSTADEAPPSPLYDRLVYWGLVKPPRDFDAFHRTLRERGLTRRLGETGQAPPRRPLDDMEKAVARIRALFAEPSASHRSARTVEEGMR